MTDKLVDEVNKIPQRLVSQEAQEAIAALLVQKVLARQEIKSLRTELDTLKLQVAELKKALPEPKPSASKKSH